MKKGVLSRRNSRINRTTKKQSNGDVRSSREENEKKKEIEKEIEMDEKQEENIKSLVRK